MSKIEHIGNGVFIDLEPVDSARGRRRSFDRAHLRLRRFRSLEHVSYGLMLTAGDPRGVKIDSTEVGEYGMEPLSQFWQFKDALEEIERDRKGGFEDVPYVEIETEEAVQRSARRTRARRGRGRSLRRPWPLRLP